MTSRALNSPEHDNKEDEDKIKHDKHSAQSLNFIANQCTKSRSITLQVSFTKRNSQFVSIPKLGILGRQKKSRNLFAVADNMMKEEEKKNTIN